MLADISVIVTCYNYGKYLERCLRSVFNQDHDKLFTYEVLVVDDAGQDNAIEICRKFEQKFPNLKTIRNLKNQGVARSSNIAIQTSEGRYIVRIDADDYVSRHFLFVLKFALDKNRKYQAFCVDYVEVDEFENQIRVVSAAEEEIACGVMYRREHLYEIGLYNEQFEYREGHELNKRFRETFKIGYLPIPLYYARKHINNRTKNLEKTQHYDKLLATQ